MTTISGNNYTYLAADVVNSVGQLIIRIPTANSADILPTAADLITLFTGSNSADNVGQSLTFSIYNNSNFNVDISSNTGITFVSVSSDTIVPQAVRTYTVVQTAVSTALVYIIGNSPANPAVDTTLYLNNNNIYVGSSNNVAVGVPMSGDVSIVASGAASLVATTNNTLATLSGLTTASSLVTVGTIGTGVWQGTLIGPTYGGTGVNNASRTITIGGGNFSTNTATAIGSTATTNQLFFTSTANNLTGLASVNSSSIVTNSTGVPSWTASLTSGQFVIGSTGATPVPGTLTSVYGHVIAGGAGTLSVSNQYTNAASTAALTVTYSNGTAGVGATLTNASTQVAFTIDGFTAVIGSRILIKDQAASLQNGIYSVTTLGTVSTNWVLTRTTDFNTLTQMSQGLVVAVLSGTANAGKSFTQTTVVTTIGTSGLSFADQSIVTSGITALTGDVTASGPGSAVATLATVNSNVGTFTMPSVTVNAKGLVTAISNGSSFQNVFYAYGPTAAITVTGTTTYTTITSYQTPSFTAGAYTYASGVTTILVSGLYEICYTVQFNSNGASGSTTAGLQSRIILNGASLAGSITETSLTRIAGTTNRAHNSKSWLVSITANNTLAIQYAETTTTTPFQVTANECVFTIKRIQ